MVQPSPHSVLRAACHEASRRVITFRTAAAGGAQRQRDAALFDPGMPQHPRLRARFAPHPSTRRGTRTSRPRSPGWLPSTADAAAFAAPARRSGTSRPFARRAHRTWALVWARRHHLARPSRAARLAPRGCARSRQACPALPARAIASSPARRPQCRPGRPRVTVRPAHTPPSRDPLQSSSVRRRHVARPLRQVDPPVRRRRARESPPDPEHRRAAIDLGDGRQRRTAGQRRPRCRARSGAEVEHAADATQGVIGHAGQRRANGRIVAGIRAARYAACHASSAIADGRPCAYAVHQRGDRRVECRRRLAGQFDVDRRLQRLGKRRSSGPSHLPAQRNPRQCLGRPPRVDGERAVHQDVMHAGRMPMRLLVRRLVAQRRRVEDDDVGVCALRRWCRDPTRRTPAPAAPSSSAGPVKG